MNINHSSEIPPDSDVSSLGVPRPLTPVERDANRFLHSLDSLPREDKEAINEALVLSVDVHSTQAPRPDGTPYACHPIRVALQVVETFSVTDPDVIIAALLHDAVEDQADILASYYTGPDLFSTTEEKAYAYLEQRFGSAVTSSVRGLSNPEFIAPPGATKEELKEAKNEHYLEHVIAATSSNPSVFIVKLADFFENGLHVDSLSEPLKSKLTAKYLPLFDYFSMALEDLEAGEQLYNKRFYLKQILDAKKPDSGI